ncbi:MAG: hypothetical protein QOH99_826 [Frankiaceae bacterium]|nr:hypothetical protein [Frankiaceae bacterium]
MVQHEPHDHDELADHDVHKALIDALYAHTGLGISAASLDGCILHHDATFASLLGREGQDLRGMSYEDFLEPDDASDIPASIHRLDQSDAQQLSTERRGTRPDGSTVWLATTGRLIKIPDDARSYVVGLIRDITEERQASESANAEVASRRQAEAELAQAEADHLDLLDRTPVAVVIHVDGVIAFVNRSAVSMFAAQDANELIGLHMHDLAHPDEYEFVHRRIAQVRTGGLVATEKRDVRMLRRNGEEFLASPTGLGRLWHGTAATQVTLIDVTDVRRAAAELVQREKFHSEVLDSMAPQAIVLDASGVVLSHNRAWAEHRGRLGAAAETPIGVNFLQLCRAGGNRHSTDAVALADGIESVLRGDVGQFSIDLAVTYADGTGAWFSTNATPLTGPDGGVVLSLTDITDRKHFEVELGRQATHDPLTDLPNRVLLHDRLERALAARARRSTPVGVLFVDIDNFKLINDNYGHEAGDRVLVILANVLRDLVRPGDTVARFGGDEFVIVVEELVDEDDALALASRLLSAVRGSYPVGDASIALSASVGVAVASDTDTASDAIRNADTAMFEAKEQGRDRAALFDMAISGRSRERLEISQDLRYAVSRNELELYYQPLLDLCTGAVHSVEALARWHRPGHGLTQPMAFIGAAEDSGMIVPIGDWVLNHAAAWAAHPSRAGLCVSVNVAARQLTHAGFVDSVAQALARSGLEAARLTIELTESTVMDDPASAALVLDELKALGVRLSIDDFGTGYSSLSYLRRFHVDELKIDRSFVDGVASDESDAAIVTAIVSLAHTMGLIVVAEGIETRAQLDCLRALKCERAQGFLIATPQNEADFDVWRSANSTAPYDFAKPQPADASCSAGSGEGLSNAASTSSATAGLLNR